MAAAIGQRFALVLLASGERGAGAVSADWVAISIDLRPLSFLAGGLEQYREIVRAFEADVFRVAAPLLGSRSAAEDVTQEMQQQWSCTRIISKRCSVVTGRRRHRRDFPPRLPNAASG